MMKHFIFACSILIAIAVPAFAENSPADQTEDKTKQETHAESLEEVVVTGAREAEPLKESPQTIGVIKEEEIEEVKPGHPSEIMRRVPGVWVDTTAGEGHKTAIRQPLSTNPVYLFLEDGVPIRPTGFFNHNALYEVNIPGAERIEIMKGPATALYGSDAIGGTINVLTKPSPATPEAEINSEFGSFGWYRLLATGGNTWGNNGVRLDLNDTHSDGWRERSGYDRQSTTFRWDSIINATSKLKTVIGYSHIDQDTGGASGLTLTDFETRPSFNYQTFDFRKVKAFRLSTEYKKEINDKNVLSLIPYFRQNEMDLLPGWGIFQAGANFYGYDSVTKFYSLGLLAKNRHDFDTFKSRLITGVDIDYSPGTYSERRIQVTKSGDQYVSYTYVPNTDNDFDFDATFTGISPYLQFETSPLGELRFTVGARYDDLSYDYSTSLAPNASRPADTKPEFTHLSPKAGLTYNFTDKTNGYLTYSNGFRAPSSGDLFRGSSGTAATAVNLKPIKVDNYEAGLRGGVGRISYDTAVYYMIKKDDIVSYSPQTGVTERLNAGETVHKGIELGLAIKPVRDVELSTSYSYAIHEYREYAVSPTIDYSGNEIPLAPRQIIDTRLDYSPAFLKGGQTELEWVTLGSYWMDDANTQSYSGYDIFNIRASYYLSKQLEVYARVINITDKLYAEEATKSATGPGLYSPGQPRTCFAGVVYKWGAK
ncbi:MAG: TonB-dependent receptor [Desulfobacteraceae bacterium]|nr:TonB-dependent receptor [Desulfobacteraceae bacterium]